MPRRSYLIEQAAKARRLADAVGCQRATADLQAYATVCDRERRVLDRHDRLGRQEREAR